MALNLHMPRFHLARPTSLAHGHPWHPFHMGEAGSIALMVLIAAALLLALVAAAINLPYQAPPPMLA